MYDPFLAAINTVALFALFVTGVGVLPFILQGKGKKR